MNHLTDDCHWALPDLDAAIEWAGHRQRSGISVAIDPLGEYARNEEQATASAASYLNALARIREKGIAASLAIKLSALGLSFAQKTAEFHLNQLLAAAAQADLVVEIDIEGTPSVPQVCEMAQNAACRGFKTVLALQAYLDRTPRDLADSLAAGLKVRLVKGAYKGDTDDFARIQQMFLALFEKLLAAGRPFDVGTHDPLLLKAMTARLGTHNREQVCFGFLKGLADATKDQMASSGYLVSEYVPFGDNRAAYVTRRLAYLKRLAALGLAPSP